MMRRSVWRLSIAAVALVLGCSAEKEKPLPAGNDASEALGTLSRPESLFSGSPIGLAVTRDGERQSLDEEVLSIVIADLVEYQGKDAMVQAPMDRPERIYLDTSFLNFSPTKESILQEYVPEYWQAINDINRDELELAATNLGVRTKKVDQFKLATSDSRILTDPNLVPESNRNFQRSIALFLPGYNANQDVCVVFASIPWSKHHADATFILQKVDGKWILRLRQFVLYY